MPSPSAYAFVAERAGHRCEYCLAPEALFNAPFEVEHIVPLTRAGPTVARNLALACRSCNAHKGGATVGIDPQSRRTAPLFHPRREAWDDHFALETATGLIVGQTGTGRATVRRLAMNAPRALGARLIWMALHWYP